MDTDPAAKPFRWYKGLRARLIVLLSLVVLPIGLIAVYQTDLLAKTAEKNAEKALLALSDRAAQEDRLIIQRAFGAAGILGELAPLLLNRQESCSAFLKNFMQKESDFGFIGIVPRSGISSCSTNEEPLDFSGLETWPDLLAEPRQYVEMNPASPGSEASVLVASSPFSLAGEFAGYVIVSIPHRRLASQNDQAELPVSDLVHMFTMNEAGEILTAEGDLVAAQALLPKSVDRSVLATKRPLSFQAQSAMGKKYLYTVVPLDDSPVKIVRVWKPSKYVETPPIGALVSASLFPALMWLATVIVAIMALNTLVIRHISTLRRQMVRFATDRKVPAKSFDSSVPNELVDMQMRFTDMTDDILREEARLEAMVREQNVLAKEVHHRVKNNLQMISSIMNMQIRSAEHDETVETLQKVQDRITSLAHVHQDLSSSVSEGRINVSSLIQRTVQNSIDVGVPDRGAIDVQTEFDEIWLYPDQGVSLSLLASEAITNGIKYMSTADGSEPELYVTLKKQDDTCTLTVCNTIDPDNMPDNGSGIGSKLIKAFAIKLGAESEITRDDDTFTLVVTFHIAEFQLQSQDF